MRGFYWYVGFDQTIVKYILFITAVVLLVYNIKPLMRSFTKKKTYDRIVAIIIFLILLTFVISFAYWGQSPILTFRAAASQFVFLYYFILKKYRVSFDIVLKLVTIFAAIYFILWLIAITAAPTVLFGNLDEVADDRGFFRILQLPGIDNLCLFYFICLVKISRESKRKMWWIVLTMASYIIIFLSLSRNLIFVVSFVTLLFLLLYYKKALLAFGIVLALGGYSLFSNNEILNSLFSMTMSEVEERSENNLRLVEYTEFTKQYPFNIGTFLFGNGEPHVLSSYGQREESLKTSIGFNRSDAGYVHILTSYGIVMMLFLLFLLHKVYKQKVSYNHLGFKLFIFMLFLVNVLSSSFFSYAVSFMISLYALEKDKEEQRKLLSTYEA